MRAAERPREPAIFRGIGEYYGLVNEVDHGPF
jgi:hypothetical protein